MNEWMENESRENGVQIAGVRHDEGNSGKGVDCASYVKHFSVFWRLLGVVSASTKPVFNNQWPLLITEHVHTIENLTSQCMQNISFDRYVPKILSFSRPYTTNS